MKKSSKFLSFLLFNLVFCFGNVFSMERSGEIPIEENQVPIDPNSLLIQALNDGLQDIKTAIIGSQQADPRLLQGLQDIKLAIKPPKLKSKWQNLKDVCWKVTWPIRWIPRAVGSAFAVLTSYEVGKWIQFRFLTQDLPKAGYYLAHISEYGKISLSCFLSSELSQTAYDMLFERKQTARNLVVVVITGAVATIKYL